MHARSLLILGIAACCGVAGAAPSTTPSRVSLVSFAIRGAYEDIRSYWDIGVKPTMDGEDLTCEVLAPRPASKASKEKWAPFDFYTNITAAQKEDGTDVKYMKGESDVFFKGDDDNRNASSDSHALTRTVTDSFRGSLEFLQKKQGKDWFSFLMHFQRGKVEYKGLVLVRTWPEDGECKAAAFHCTDLVEKDGVFTCEADGWTRRLTAILAKADLFGASFDWRVTDEKKKNDVSAIFGVFQDVDKDGLDKGASYEEKLASK
jgi:hypothetical protein